MLQSKFCRNVQNLQLALFKKAGQPEGALEQNENNNVDKTLQVPFNATQCAASDCVLIELLGFIEASHSKRQESFVTCQECTGSTRLLTLGC